MKDKVALAKAAGKVLRVVVEFFVDRRKKKILKRTHNDIVREDILADIEDNRQMAEANAKLDAIRRESTP